MTEAHASDLLDALRDAADDLSIIAFVQPGDKAAAFDAAQKLARTAFTRITKIIGEHDAD